MAIKFKLVETGLDALNNITVNGYYVDGDVRVSEDKVFSFDPTEVSLAGMQDAVSKAQPDPTAIQEANDKKTAAETALAKLDSFVGTDVALDEYVSPEA
jgi:hypothetical protein